MKLQDHISHRYVASIRFNELSENDVDQKDNHILKLINSEGSISYHITISRSSSCKSSQNPKTGANLAGCNSIFEKVYRCNLHMDQYCRCYHDSCCSTNPEYKGAFQCQECIERSQTNCLYCTKDRDECMTFEKSAKFRGNLTYVCRD